MSSPKRMVFCPLGAHFNWGSSASTRCGAVYTPTQPRRRSRDAGSNEDRNGSELAEAHWKVGLGTNSDGRLVQEVNIAIGINLDEELLVGRATPTVVAGIDRAVGSYGHA